MRRSVVPCGSRPESLVEREADVVLLVHDVTEMADGYRPAIKGLGAIGNGSHQGFFVHTVLALVPNATSERVLGVFAQTPWVRQSSPAEAEGRQLSRQQLPERWRESEVWGRAVEQAGSPPA